MPYKKLIIIFFILSFLIINKSHAQNSSITKNPELKYFLAINFGSQMSGIKDEDFISSNYSPLFNITAGKGITSYLALQLGYKGFFFYTIADEIKHYYNYFYAEAVINFSNLVHSDRGNKKWNLILHGGPGYFYNHVYRRASLHVNLGIQNTFQLTDYFHASVDIAAIAGWDIYQGNKDILPGVSMGVIYFFE